MKRKIKRLHKKLKQLKKIKFRATSKIKRFRLKSPSKVKLKKVKTKKHGKRGSEITLAISRLKEKYIETSIDKLFELIEKKGKVSLGYAAKTIGYPKSEIEEWAKALAGHGLIEINYNMFNTILKKKSVKK